MHKRSLLHSFERPQRNIDSFVKSVLGYNQTRVDTESDEDSFPIRAGRNKKKEPKERKVRSLSLDRDRLHKSSLSIYSEGMERICDSKSQQSSDERISLKSDLLGYQGHLRSGVRTVPKNRTSTYTNLISRRDDMMREFNRSQRKCITNVEYIFDKSHRDIEMALIDMKIDLAYSRFWTNETIV